MGSSKRPRSRRRVRRKRKRKLQPPPRDPPPPKAQFRPKRPKRLPSNRARVRHRKFPANLTPSLHPKHPLPKRKHIRRAQKRTQPSPKRQNRRKLTNRSRRQPPKQKSYSSPHAPTVCEFFFFAAPSCNSALP